MLVVNGGLLLARKKSKIEMSHHLSNQNNNFLKWIFDWLAGVTAVPW
jgi:hypothetical protein